MEEKFEAVSRSLAHPIPDSLDTRGPYTDQTVQDEDKSRFPPNSHWGKHGLIRNRSTGKGEPSGIESICVSRTLDTCWLMRVKGIKSLALDATFVKALEFCKESRDSTRRTLSGQGLIPAVGLNEGHLALEEVADVIVGKQR